MIRDLTCVFGAFLLPACTLDTEGRLVVDADRGDDDVEVGRDEEDTDLETRRDAGSRDARIDGAASGEGDEPSGQCDRELAMLIRDFTPTHPDFESFTSALQGIVKDKLDSDHKPVHASSAATKATSGPDAFAQWFNGSNLSLRIDSSIALARVGDALRYDNPAFFPIDGMGYGNGPGGIALPIVGSIGGAQHNFLFTTESHATFVYRGGETFTIRADDDTWLFIDDELAIDLGGVHDPITASVSLDDLGLKRGKRYALDLFHAERHTPNSALTLDTTITCLANAAID